MFNLFRLCRKDEISFDIVAVCGNNVECCFDKVERSFDNVACCFDIVDGVDRVFRQISLWLGAGHLLQQVDISAVPVLSFVVKVVQSARDLAILPLLSAEKHHHTLAGTHFPSHTG